MKLIKFKNEEYYREVQRATDRRKSKRPSVSPKEIDRIAAHLKKKGESLVCIDSIQGICHGARYGHELDFFKSCLPGAVMVGTDLFDKGDERTVIWDFHKENPEWIGRFDFVYSNSLDHAHDPALCVKVWLDQLKSDGLLFVVWGRSQLNVRGGDCYGAHLDEYMRLFYEHGEVDDLIYVGGKSRRYGRSLKTVVVVKKKE